MVSLVLLPGLDGTGDLFEPLINCLPIRINPIVVSYPKYRPCGYKDLKPIVIEALPRNTDFVILGESFSGPLAIMTAGERPPGLKGVILCASFIKKPFRWVPSWTSRLSISPLYRLWPVTIQLRAVLGRRKEKELADMALKAVRSVAPAVISERVKTILSVNVEAELKKCDVPLLYLAGAKDRLIKTHNIESITKVKKDVQISIIDTRHFILQMEPEWATKEIIAFLEKMG